MEIIHMSKLKPGEQLKKESSTIGPQNGIKWIYFCDAGALL